MINFMRMIAVENFFLITAIIYLSLIMMFFRHFWNIMMERYISNFKLISNIDLRRRNLMKKETEH